MVSLCVAAKVSDCLAGGLRFNVALEDVDHPDLLKPVVGVRHVDQDLHVAVHVDEAEGIDFSGFYPVKQILDGLDHALVNFRNVAHLFAIGSIKIWGRLLNHNSCNRRQRTCPSGGALIIDIVVNDRRCTVIAVISFLKRVELAIIFVDFIGGDCASRSGAGKYAAC